MLCLHLNPRLTSLRLHQRLNRPDRHSPDWLVPFRPQPQLQPQIQPEVVPASNESVRLFHGFRVYRISEGQTCNQALKEKIDFGTQHLDPDMQKIELENLNMVKFWKEGMSGIVLLLSYSGDL